MQTGVVIQWVALMVNINGNELVFAFPDVDGEMRVHFRRADLPGEVIPLIQEPAGEGFRLAAFGRAVMHLRPRVVDHQSSYGTEMQTMRYPFAVLVMMGGLNALTGEPTNSLIRSPQNYFASPPQGGIDGYFVQGEVRPFRGAGDELRDTTRLDIKVFPMKRDVWEELMGRRQMCGWYHPAISGLTINHGGERQCEPVYEDLCCLGEWDQQRGEIATVWLKR